MAFLELIALEKRYDTTPVVTNLDAKIDQGAFVSLLGPSGCGKSTTLRMIAGFVAPTSGSIRLRGRLIDDDPPYRRNIGLVFQNYALFPHMTAAQNVAFGLRMRRVPASERQRRVTRALDQVGLGGLADRYPARMSGGQQQRVALARALVIEPDLLLLDEPLSNLDATLRAEMRDEIRQLQRRLGITTLFVTHDQQEALAMSDRIMVMEHGRVVDAAEPEQLSEHPRTLFSAAFLGARTILPGSPTQTATGRRFATTGGIDCRMDEDDPIGATHLVLRSARLRVDRDSAPPHAWLAAPATVTASVYLGDMTQLDLRAGIHSLRALLPTDLQTPAVGETVTLWADRPAVAFLSDADADQTITGRVQ